MTTIFNSIPLGVQSFCYRKFSNEQIIEELKELGLNHLEICAVHLNAKDGLEQAGQIAKLYKSSGIRFNSYGINGMPNNEKEVRAHFDFARSAGLKLIGGMPHRDAVPLLERLCEEYGIKIAIHNHGPHQDYGTIAVLEEILANTSDAFGVCLDTGWMIDSSEDPVEAVKRLSGRIYGVHFKDFSYSDGQREEAILGEGSLDVQGMVDALRKADFNGYATIEYEGHPEQPTAAIRRCVEVLQAACE